MFDFDEDQSAQALARNRAMEEHLMVLATKPAELASSSELERSAARRAQSLRFVLSYLAQQARSSDPNPVYVMQRAAHVSPVLALRMVTAIARLSLRFTNTSEREREAFFTLFGWGYSGATDAELKAMSGALKWSDTGGNPIRYHAKFLPYLVLDFVNAPRDRADWANKVESRVRTLAAEAVAMLRDGDTATPSSSRGAARSAERHAKRALVLELARTVRTFVPRERRW